MNSGGGSKVFLERRGYRTRRMMDALRLLPVLGLFLWLLPLFWVTEHELDKGTAPVAMSVAVTYVFVVWVMLIAIALFLWIALRVSQKTGGLGESSVTPDGMQK